MTNENEMENLDSLNQEEEVVETNEAEAAETPEVSQEEIEELRKKAELADNYKKRAEKAEKKAKTSAGKVEQNNTELSSRDLLSLMSNSITEQEDIDYLTKTAKGFGMSVADAIKDPVIKGKLDERVETRTTAAATDTSGGRRGSTKVSDESLLANAEKGMMPESDADMQRLIKARKESRRR